MGLLLGGPTLGGIFIFEIWWAYYPVGLLSSGLTYGILRYARLNFIFLRIYGFETAIAQSTSYARFHMALINKETHKKPSKGEPN